MKAEIKQICEKINSHSVSDKKIYPAWFFTNEKISDFLGKFNDQNLMKNVFSCGSGDFAFNCLSIFENVNMINNCDIRPLSNITIDLKTALIKNLSDEELSHLFKDLRSDNKDSVYKKIRNDITSSSRDVFDSIVDNSEHNNFMQCLRKSGHWFRWSFSQYKDEYLGYLNGEKYKILQKNINKLNIYSGDFNDNLQLSDDNFYDLIYASNIFDSKNYCSRQDDYIQTIQKKMNRNGYLLVVTMHRPKKIVKLIKKHGLNMHKKEVSKFGTLKSLFLLNPGEYEYSFLVFKKINRDYVK